MNIVGQVGKIILFMLPVVALLANTFVYLAPTIFLYVGVMIFIGTEERLLTQAFGRIDRLVSFKKPLSYRGYFSFCCQ